MISHLVSPQRSPDDASATVAWRIPRPLVLRLFAVLFLALTVFAAPVITGGLPVASAQANPNPNNIDVGDLDEDLIESICNRDGDDPLPNNECKDKLIDEFGDKFEDSVCTGKDANGCIEKLLSDKLAEEEKSKRESSEAPPEDYSLYRLSSANTSLFFDAIGMSPDTAPNDDTEEDGGLEADESSASGLSSDWADRINKPANAGAFLGVCDNEVTPGPSTCSRFYGDNETKFTVNHNYSTFRNYASNPDDNYDSNGSDPAGHAASRGVYEYSQFGAALSNMGFMETVTDQANPKRAVMGNLMLGGFLLAGSIDAFFDMVLSALIFINPFRLFFEAVQENSDTDYDIANEGVDDGVMSDLSNFIGTLYSGLVNMSWMATIPIFIGLFFAGAVMLRRFDKGSNFKKLAVRVTFIALGFTLLGSTYTAALDSFSGAESNGRSINANRVILTTYIDYDNWVMQKRLALPEGVSVAWNENKKSIDGRTAMNLRNYAREVNASIDPVYAYGENNDAPENSNGYKNLLYGSEIFKDSDEDNNTFQQFDAVWSLMNRYIRGDSITGVAFEQRVKSSYKSMAVKANAEGENALRNLFTGYSDPEVLKTMSPEDISAYAVAFVNGSGLSVNYENAAQPGGGGVGASDDPVGATSTMKFYSGSGAGCKADEVGTYVPTDGGKFIPEDGCNLSPLSMYNFLNTTFQDTNLTVQSGRNADSGYVKANHASVAQVGDGVMGVLYWFSSLSILISFALIGIFYALAMLFSNIKRSIQLIAAVPFATLGFMGGIAKVIIYTIAMIAEIVLTLFVYRVIQEFLMAIPAIMEVPLVQAFAGEDEVANSVVQGISAATFSAIFGSNPAVATLLVTLLSTGGIIVFTMIALKLRNSVISAIDEAVTNTVNNLLDTSVGSTGSGGGSAVGRQLMTAGALAAGHRIATGGQSDEAEAVATGAGAGDGSDGDGSSGADGSGGPSGPGGPGGDDRSIDGGGMGQYDEHGRLVASSVGGAGTAMLGADGEADAFADQAGDGEGYVDAAGATPGAAATGEYYMGEDGSYVDSEGNPVGMESGPIADGEGGHVAPDGTPLTTDEQGNYVDANTGEAMYDAADNPEGKVAESLAAHGDVRGQSDAELAAQVGQQGGLSDAAGKTARAAGAAGLGAATLAQMGGADAAAQIHGSDDMTMAASGSETTGSELAAAGGKSVGGTDSGMYQMEDGSVAVASDSEIGQAIGSDGSIGQSPFNSEALASAGGTEMGAGSGVYSMPDGSTVAAADSGLSSANSDFVANSVDNALDSSGGAVGMSNMSASELAAAGGSEVASGTGLYQMEDGSVMAANDSAIAAQHAASGESAGSALVTDQSSAQLASAGGQELGNSGIYSMPDGSAMVAADSPTAEQAGEMGTSQDVAASDMTSAQLAASGAQEVGSNGVYSDGQGNLIAASDGASAGGGKAVNFGTTSGNQVAEAMQAHAAGMNTPAADSGAAGGMSALSNAMDAAPAAAAQLKDELGGTQGLAAAGGGAAAAGAAGIGAISRQAAINRANGMDPVAAYQTAQQQVGGTSAGAGANQDASGAGANQDAGSAAGVNPDVSGAVNGIAAGAAGAGTAAGIGAAGAGTAAGHAAGTTAATGGAAQGTSIAQGGQAGQGGQSGANTAQSAGQSAGQNQVVNTGAGQQQASPDTAQQSERRGMSPMAYPLVNAAVNAATAPGPAAQSMRDSATGGQKNRKATPPPAPSGGAFSGMMRPAMMGMMMGQSQNQPPEVNGNGAGNGTGNANGGNQGRNGLTARDIALLRGRGENKGDRNNRDEQSDNSGRDEFGADRDSRAGSNRGRDLSAGDGGHGSAATGDAGGNGGITSGSGD